MTRVRLLLEDGTVLAEGVAPRTWADEMREEDERIMARWKAGDDGGAAALAEWRRIMWDGSFPCVQIPVPSARTDDFRDEYRIRVEVPATWRQVPIASEYFDFLLHGPTDPCGLPFSIEEERVGTIVGLDRATRCMIVDMADEAWARVRALAAGHVPVAVEPSLFDAPLAASALPKVDLTASRPFSADTCDNALAVHVERCDACQHEEPCASRDMILAVRRRHFGGEA